MEALLPVGILLIFALGASLAIFGLTTLLGPKVHVAMKDQPYECGIKADDDGARIPFKNRFYLIAVLFLLFDVEAAFFFPWALVYRESLSTGGMLLLAFGIYLVFLILGLAYVFRKNALELR